MWILKAAKLLIAALTLVMAAIGSVATVATTLLATGHLDLSDVAWFAFQVRETYAYLVGAGGLSALGVLIRYAVPAIAASSRERITAIVRGVVEDVLTTPGTRGGK